MFNSVPDKQEAFWKNVEASLGCSVLAYGLAQYSLAAQKTRSKRSGVWGLIYVSERGLHFYHFPQQNWFGALMKAAPSSSLSLNFFWDDIDAWRAPVKVSFFKRLLGKGDERLIVKGSSTELMLDFSDAAGGPAAPRANPAAPSAKNASATHAFMLDLRQSGIMKSLTERIGAKQVQDIFLS